MRYQMAIALTPLALLAGCANMSVESGSVDHLIFSPDHKTCQIEVNRMGGPGVGRYHLLPDDDHPATYPQQICRSGKPKGYVRYSSGRVEVTYEVTYTITKQATSKGCLVTFTPRGADWNTRITPYTSSHQCAGYISGHTLTEKHTVSSE